MSSPTNTSEKLCAIYVDLGTTNTRAWLMQGSEVVARGSGNFGVRDSAREKSARVIREGLRDLIARIRREKSRECSATCIAAAGMLTSSHGLAEVPHIPAPAGLDELASSVAWHQLDDVCDLPILLVPGVHCGPMNPRLEQMDAVDVMRGEETLCAGLVALNLVGRPAAVLNLGSHWKVILLDDRGRVLSSVTSLSGELMHATQQNTILAGSVATAWPDQLSQEWLKSGMQSARTSGLARALFCVRLLDLSRHGNPEDRLAFAIGAFIASDLAALLRRGALDPEVNVAIVGSKAVSHAWRFALSGAGIRSTLIPALDAENAFLTALRLILEKARYLLNRSSVHENIRRTFRS